MMTRYNNPSGSFNLRRSEPSSVWKGNLQVLFSWDSFPVLARRMICFLQQYSSAHTIINNHCTYLLIFYPVYSSIHQSNTISEVCTKFWRRSHDVVAPMRISRQCRLGTVCSVCLSSQLPLIVCGGSSAQFSQHGNSRGTYLRE